ncbi:hypothetical protein [Halobacillus sp. K22]|uniref:hypothetical protein n=1 Tax=Halobacillus sp. K22 TaxID=3457431 RepID=UPI003FCE4537
MEVIKESPVVKKQIQGKELKVKQEENTYHVEGLGKVTKHGELDLSKFIDDVMDS